MTRNYASLQRRPFLTPIWVSVLAVLFGACVVGFAAWVWGTADSTTIVVIRNAEEDGNGGADPPLSAAGTARALLLARMFGDGRSPGHIDAIYVSPPLRNRMTAAPLAAKLGITPVVASSGEVRGWVRSALHDHAGGRILVVGHEDAMTDILETLTHSKQAAPSGGYEYGTLYIVTVPRIGRANFLRLNY